MKRDPPYEDRCLFVRSPLQALLSAFLLDSPPFLNHTLYRLCPNFTIG